MTKEIKTYICNYPYHSNILAFQNFCKRRVFGIDLLCGIGLSLVGGAILLIFISGVFFSSQSLEQILQIALSPPIQFISLLWLLCMLFVIICEKKHWANFKFYIIFPLITALLASIYYLYPTQILSNWWYLNICLSGLLLCGGVMFAIGLLSSYSVIEGHLIAKKILTSLDEYHSHHPHTGILIPINILRLADFSSIEGISPLAEGFFKSKKEPYRIYFCFTKNEVARVIEDSNVINLWIFGHGSRGGVDVNDGPFYYDSLKNSNIPKKGYIHQYHCNCWIDEHDNTSLVDLLVDADDKKKSTDTGTQNRILKLFCKIPLLSYIGNYFLNSRNPWINKKGIKQYLQEQKSIEKSEIES
ncbi:hypothetical protein [Methanorbis furvi]|uniref:Uncharacterized protein n=1 Tax=Methanorbis furvi TaxID=3028299 RepID=A0AAE4MCJ2_9EURY|nr:hypothetical protein [Methanocorpusculaceae archaeon Ag1]